ncbi:MAG: hypothetical protein ACD_21C00271G0007, partial [uncultured bacterium]
DDTVSSAGATDGSDSSSDDEDDYVHMDLGPSVLSGKKRVFEDDELGNKRRRVMSYDPVPASQADDDGYDADDEAELPAPLPAGKADQSTQTVLSGEKRAFESDDEPGKKRRKIMQSHPRFYSAAETGELMPPPAPPNTPVSSDTESDFSSDSGSDTDADADAVSSADATCGSDCETGNSNDYLSKTCKKRTYLQPQKIASGFRETQKDSYKHGEKKHTPESSHADPGPSRRKEVPPPSTPQPRPQGKGMVVTPNASPGVSGVFGKSQGAAKK